MQHLRLQLATDKPDTVLSMPATLYAQSWKTTSKELPEDRANGKATFAVHHQRKVRSLKPREKMVPKHWDTDTTKVRLKWILSRHCIYTTSYSPPQSFSHLANKALQWGYQCISAGEIPAQDVWSLGFSSHRVGMGARYGMVIPMLRNIRRSRYSPGLSASLRPAWAI